MRTQQLKNRTAKGFNLNKMNDDTYALRRKVIDIIYEAKNRGFKLPRIEVRVVNTETERACGYAYLNQKVVHINEKWINKDIESLTHIVLHEIVHAVTGFAHDSKCYLMQPQLPYLPTLSKSWDRFAHYIK